jgi:D-glycero-D-manno-heptose 1,7-bisphosphate phosphatase
MTRLILLDRDGVINLDSPRYIKDVEEWLPIPGALDAIARLKAAGYLVAVCTNQAGVGRGILSTDALTRIHARLRQELAGRGAVLDDLRYCPHPPDAGCECRKPRPGMLIGAMETLGATPDETVFVGDSIRDVEAAQAAGCRVALVRTGGGADAEEQARSMGVDWVEDDLAAVARTLIGAGSC